jgi:molecular chaperone GrpE
MTGSSKGGREHSRASGGADLGARSGAGQLADERQAFANTGHLTGRDIPPQEVPEPSGKAIDVAKVGEELARLTQERDEFKADLQRMAADFANFRTRSDREKQQAASAADAKLLGELLIVLDDLERALEHIGDSDAGDSHSQLVEGIRLVQRRLLDVLTAHGLVEIDASGAFDPHLHEAVLMQPPPAGVAEGAILQVAQKGYAIGDRVVRHAKVIVAGT